MHVRRVDERGEDGKIDDIAGRSDDAELSELEPLARRRKAPPAASESAPARPVTVSGCVATWKEHGWPQGIRPNDEPGPASAVA